MTKNKPIRRTPVDKKHVVTVYLDAEFLAKLDAIRNSENRSRGNMILQIIRRYFLEREAQVETNDGG
jgi:metal-responsive CopG/Arc/MetJ family transcriptional regulator